MIKFSNIQYQWDRVLNTEIPFKTMGKYLQTTGNLVYEYNPLRNYRLTENKYNYNNQLLTLSELEAQGIRIVDNKWEGVPEGNSEPQLIEKGSLVDFETDELKFSLKHPVHIVPQPSYDGSVNLIFNDNLNIPRLVNSRFSPTGKNTYEIVDRQGDNDSNIYNQGTKFDVDTSLYKRINTIPKLEFVTLKTGGSLKVGNYHFYFKYSDSDGNETDFVAESGLVSVFIGEHPKKVRQGFSNENSQKLVKFRLSDIDSSYSYVSVYYTRSTSQIYEEKTVIAQKVLRQYPVSNNSDCTIIITGLEEVQDISTADINNQYNLVNSARTSAECQNMLFLGNVHKADVDYKELQDLSLRFLPYLSLKQYKSNIDYNYNVVDQGYVGYYDPYYIYNYVGYWDKELYRLGIVYILNDNSLSPVFNIRGRENLTLYNSEAYTEYPLYSEDGTRNYIQVDETTNLLLSTTSNAQFENNKGVIQFNPDQNLSDNLLHQIYGINIKASKEVLQEIKKHAKGFFFVRQKRIMTTLCQALTIGVDKEANIPMIPISALEYFAERFIDDDRGLNLQYTPRLYRTKNVRFEGALCPEYDIDSPFYNSFFTGDNFQVELDKSQPKNNYFFQDKKEPRHYYNTEYLSNFPASYDVKIIGVEDNTQLVAIDDKEFSSRAGYAEEAFRFSSLGNPNTTEESSNLVRGSYGPFLGITELDQSMKLINIKIPGYSDTKLRDYFEIRCSDSSPFYAISDRISIDSIIGNLDEVYYRGDCYICQFTHRVNRNFQDPTAPINSQIVDPNTWKEHYKPDTQEELEKINRGDVNAINLGSWVTFIVKSSRNLNVRAIDDSNVQEISLTGHPRGFYPYQSISADGSFKIPEALCTNKGYDSTVSERYNFEVPDVPYIKDWFGTRIMYSDIHVNDAFKNGYRVFQGQHYRDYTRQYGEIVKLVPLGSDLLCVFEHGIALIPINERALAGEGSGGNIYVNTSNVLPENPKILSDIYGSQWEESIIKTPRWVYGVDTTAKKIWRVNSTGLELISDFKVQEFLNNNITLTERELEPIIGIRNIKTHYNSFKQDIMFTFYDNLYGYTEKVWNLCFNEVLNKWITFYSWVPSYSQNIDNMFFSFDRNTSKWIAKLGTSKYNSDFSDGVTLENNIITGNGFSTTLHLSNRELPKGTGVSYSISYELQRDNFGNYKLFSIENDRLIFNGNYEDIISELYKRDQNGNITVTNGIKSRLNRNQQKNPDKIVLLLNIRANIQISYEKSTLANQYALKANQDALSKGGYYESTVALIPEYNLQFLTTDFWKHGQAGIIDISDPIYPTQWYGKQHPFEFEFIVADNPQVHKIFDNLQIISNSAEPESFHYELIGDCYNFAEDKKNMYIRQEATKELYQYNGSDVTYDTSYTALQSYHRSLIGADGNPVPDRYDRSVILPLYYARQDSINEVEDTYHLKDGAPTKDFAALSGGEIVYYKNLNEYRVWSHAKAVDMNFGRLRGNMQYNEDQWLVQINPINIIYKNEPDWSSSKVDIFNRDNLSSAKVPIELGQSPLPNDALQSGDITYDPNDPTRNDIPQNSMDRSIVLWDKNSIQTSEVKLKDKWIKIRIRYTGNKLAIISAIKTLYSISYS